MSSFEPRRVLVTGGAGFIGGNFVRHLLESDPAIRIWNLDALTYAGNLASLSDVEARFGPGGDSRYHFIRSDIGDFDRVAKLLADAQIDSVVHFAAESHVDRSILGPEVFLTTNVLGTFRLLEACRKAWSGRCDVRFHHVSTDEVFGSLGPDGRFTETTPYDPSSPYSASKAASDHLVRAWHRTYGLPVTLSNCSNNYGPWQFPEKLIPLVILNCLEGRPIPVYGRGDNVRDWLHVRDHCVAVDRILRCGQIGATYNVGGDGERRNIEVVGLLCDLVDELNLRASGVAHCRDLITFVTDRPGHDLRYAIDWRRIGGELGWRPEVSLADGLRETVRWYAEHRDWCRQVTSGEYRSYYDRQYGRRLQS